MIDTDVTIETYVPFENQIKFHKATQRNKLYGGAMGGGKSRTLCEDIHRLMVKYPTNRGYIGRKHFNDFKLTTYLILIEKTLAEYIENELVVENKQDKYFQYWNGSKLYYGGLVSSGKQDEKLFSAEFGVIAIDEAFELTEKEFMKLGTRLRHRLKNDKHPPFYMLLASNPSQNWLKRRFILSPSSNDIFVPALPKDNPHNPDDYVSYLRNLFSADEQMIKAFIEGSWDAIGDPDSLLTMDDVIKCINLDIDTRYGKIKRFTSCDSSGMGDDKTVIFDWETAQYNEKKYYKIIGNESYGYRKNSENIGKLQWHKEKIKGNAIIVDPIGEGSGLYSDLDDIARGWQALSVDFRGTANTPEKYYNIRAEGYWMLKKVIKEERICLPDIPQLHSELCAIKWKPVGSTKGTKILIIPKEEIKAELGHSPDFSDCCVIGVYGEEQVNVIEDITRDRYARLTNTQDNFNLMG